MRKSTAADGWTEANLYFLLCRKCKQVLVPLPEKNGNRDTITVLFSYIRLRRVILLCSYIWLAPSDIALRAVLEANII